MQIHYYSFSRFSILPWRSWHYWHLVIKLSNEFVWVLDTNLSGNKSNTTLSLIGEICHNRTSVTSAAEDDLSKQYIASGFHIKRILSSVPVPWLFIWNNNNKQRAIPTRVLQNFSCKREILWNSLPWLNCFLVNYLWLKANSI